MSLFRQEAVEHHQRDGMDDRTPLRVSPPWTWALFWAAFGALGLLAVWSIFGTIPVTERGTAILLSRENPRPLIAHQAGRVRMVHVGPGAMVRVGDPILEVEAPAVEVQAILAVRDREIAEDELRDLAAREAKVFQEQVALVQSKIKNAQDQVRSLDRSIEIQTRKVIATETLRREGLVSGSQLDDAREALEGVLRAQKAAQQSLAQHRQDLASLEAQRGDRTLARKRELGRVEASAQGQEVAQGQMVIRATADGMVEGLHLLVGDSVQIGEELGRVVPLSGPLEVVAFLPERHRAFLKEGGEAVVEIDQLPYGEFGTARARIRRVGLGLATPKEVQAALGAAAPTQSALVRVELDLLDEQPARKAGVQFKAGMLGQARFVLRRQRVIARFIAPLRRLLD